MDSLKTPSLVTNHDRCAQEQVQLIGHIQSHGLLFALSEPDLLVRQVSANVTAFLGISPDILLGRSFAAVLEAPQFATFKSLARSGDPLHVTMLRLPGIGCDLEMRCIVHRQDQMLLVELEPSLGAHSLDPLDIDAHIRIPLSHMELASDTPELSKSVVNEIRRLSGFDRVMVYQFDEDWNGEVIAEAMGTSPVSYYGLRFPAGDIPPQVRRLCIISPVRVIADVASDAAAILPEIGPLTGRPLDLTKSVLRSASPVHLEYLRNMDVQASLTVSIIVERQLWGMIACHHPTPHRVDHSIRSVCELIGQIFASQITLRNDNAALQSRLASRKLLEQFMAGIETARLPADAVRFEMSELLELFDADAVICRINGLVSSQGVDVEAGLLLPVINKLKDAATRGIASSSKLGDVDSSAASYATSFSGALYIGLADGTDDYLLLLRRELVETVVWAGDRSKAVTSDNEDRLHPRKSFSAWHETVRGRSRKWTAFETERASFLREQLLRLRAVHALAVANESLERQIIERHKSESALREAEQKYRGIFDESLAGIFQLRPDGRLLGVNPAMAVTLGYSTPDEMLSSVTGPLWQLAVSPERRDEFMKLMQEFGHVKSFELQVFRKDRSKIWISTSIRAVTQSGIVDRIEGMSEDITERKILREQLLQAQKLESIGQLAAGIAHEINTPTQYIGDNVRFLKDSFKELIALLDGYGRLLSAARANTLTGETVHEVAAIAERTDIAFLFREIPSAIDQSLEGVNRVTTLVRAMKEFSHPGSREKTSLDLNRAIQSTITVATNEWKYVAELETDLDPRLPTVSCLPGEFNQVILNLIVNAAQAITETLPKGSTSKGRIKVQTRNYLSWVEIRIEDTGPGIPEKLRPRIFEPFFTTKQVGKGTGQGLAIARSVIVDHHNGSIRFETEEGRGTTFIIRLPHEGKTLGAKPAAG